MTYVIAEAGVNHNGDVETAMRLCDVARDAGCDAVKFQTFNSEAVVTRQAGKAPYQAVTTGTGSQLAMIRSLELPWEEFVRIAEHCRSLNIEFMSSAFDSVSLASLEALGVSRHKLASGEITNLPFLRQLGSYRKPTLLSTGMATLAEVEAALVALAEAGTSRELVTVLHCNTEYPTPANEVNLRAMLTLREAFKTSVGFSDHTDGIEVALAAVALGAEVIEKHITLDRSSEGPDHRASLEPAELKRMIEGIRTIEAALGDGIKRPMAGEARNRVFARRSVVAARAIRAGESFTSSNLVAKRPATGISPMRWDEILGKKARRDFAVDELIEL